MMLGTLEYMAPEQVEGKEADHRTDIFALGVVIYEMATGRKAFEGDSKASLTAAILTAQPASITAIQPMTPPALERLVRKCLNKDPEERWQSADDLATELEWVSETAIEPTLPVRAHIQRRRRERLGWAIALVLLCVAGWFLGRIYTPRPVSETRSIRFTVPPPSGNPAALFASISPDGQKLAIYDGKAIWVRPLRSTQPYRLTEAGNVVEADLFWSPDSRFIAFWEIQPLFPGVEEATLKKVEITGGVARTICETSLVSKPTLLGNTARNGTWSEDGIILFERGEEPKGISRVSAEGGTPLPVTTVNESREEMDHVFPHFLPDGRHFLYTVTSKRPEVMGIYISSLDSRESRGLLDVDAPFADFAYAAPGYLLYERGRRLLAHRFDPKILSLSGEPVSFEDQPFRHPLGSNMLSVSENGTLCYLVGPLSIPAQVTKFDRTGKRIDTIGSPGDYPHIELSPDGTKLAVGENRLGKIAGDSGDLYLFDLQQGIKTRLTKAARGEWNYGAVWSPDGSQILFTSNRDKSSSQPDASEGDLYLKATTKDGAEKALLQSSQWKAPTDWSRDGRFILYFLVDTAELWMLPLFGPREPKLFLQLGFMAQFSPDGRWVAYQDFENLYVCSFPSGEGRRQISSDGGMRARWRDDGKELFYFTPDRKLMSVEVTTGPGFQFGSPKVLFENISVSFEDRPSLYDVSPDGQYFYISVIDSTPSFSADPDCGQLDR
jgi:eukaryotic-like serine/threonine-protein kinase